MAERISTDDGPLVEGARAVEQAAGRYKERIVSGTKERLDASREYVSENPVKTVLLAVGVGALIGFLVGRRSS